MLTLPADFIRNVTQAFPEGGAWLDRLPKLLEEAASRWELRLGDPFLLSYNYVCAAMRSDGAPVVLKIGVPDKEMTSEIHALRTYAGQGACRLLAADASQGMMVLERIHPGTMLATLDDDDKATEIAADVLKKIQRPAPDGGGFLSLRGWFDGLKALRPRFAGGTGSFSPRVVDLVEGLVEELFTEGHPPVLLHGDFHHFNILLAKRGWLVIDPKGVIGPAEYDVGPFLMNPIHKMPAEDEAISRTRRRIAILSEQLGFDRERIWRWAVCHSFLSSWWDVDDDGHGGEASRAWTEIFLKTKV